MSDWNQKNGNELPHVLQNQDDVHGAGFSFIYEDLVKNLSLLTGLSYA